MITILRTFYKDNNEITFDMFSAIDVDLALGHALTASTFPKTFTPSYVRKIQLEPLYNSIIIIYENLFVLRIDFHGAKIPSGFMEKIYNGFS